ncbi:MAG: BrnA antitoxin family protein [Terriglobales bacterium]
MKRRKRVARRARAARKVAKIEASAGSRRRPRYLPAEWEGMYKPVKKPVTLRLDADVLAWFQRGGRGYQTRINQALRKVMSEERRKARK